ncbi:YdcF family protein [Nakamurella lactea]|uniref:YdcF family protein n=1 Tax=Nakamurella lactea TaxID=459515 RepID=UPI0003FC80C8|nr:YdcF family protein [Nakamurella lactea]
MTGGRIVRAGGRYLAGLLVLGVLIVAGIALRTVQVGARDDRTPVDAIVVLGAAQYNGTPSPVYQARLDHAKELFDTGVAAHVVTVGGNQAGDRTTEGAAGKAYLADQGIPAASLTAVGTGDDTLDSLRAAASVIDQKGWHTVVLVTDPAHAHRASRMARDLGLSVTESSVQQGPATASDIQLRYYTRETLGTLFYLLTGGSSHAGTTVL